MDGWYYRTFDIDFGPVSHEKLVELIKAQSLSRDDEVRFGIKGGWRRVGSIGTLMAHLPFEIGAASTMKHEARGGLEGSPAATAVLETPSKPTRSSDASFSVVNPKPDGNQWWCRIQNEVFGPVDMAKVIEMAQSQVISRDDEVRFGEAGIWRRVGSIGPLMAHLPFESRENVVLGGLRTGPSDAQINTVDNEVAPAGGIENPANSGSREIEDRWWCRIENREYGPIELAKVVEWAATGRLLKTDEVRFGRDPYMAAGELAGLFPAEQKPTADDPSVSKSTNPTPKSTEAKAVTPPPKPAVADQPTPADSSPKPAPAPQMPSGSFSAPSSSAARPATPFRPPMAKGKGSSGGNDLVAKLIPVGIGIGGIAGVVALIYFAMMMIPESTVADQNRLKILQGAFDQLNNVRRSGASKPDQFAPVKEVLEKAGKTVAAELKDITDKKPHQAKLNYVAKKLQDLAKDKIEAKPGDIETNIKNALTDLDTKLNPK
ncbi:hypothetical protein [Schlesneria paludicola]|uniref:hypothetical protein n=1 Tax=Schlesneria paludicola TaxID=360056 RepID=UPI00029ABB0C|nr:hypothetical protein [Schlesneria paludicola]